MPDHNAPLPNTGDPTEENPTTEGSAPPPKGSGPRDELTDAQLGASSDDDDGRARDGKRGRGQS